MLVCGILSKRNLKQLSRKRWFEIENKLIKRWNFTCTENEVRRGCKSFHSNIPWLQTHCIVLNGFCTVYGMIHYHCSLHVCGWMCCIGSECVAKLWEWIRLVDCGCYRRTYKSARFSPIACGFQWLITSINILLRTFFFFLTVTLPLFVTVWAHQKFKAGCKSTV